MYTGSVFVYDIIEDVLKLKITSNDYENLGGVTCDRNVFYYCVTRNYKFLNYQCATALKSVIIREIKNDILKKIKVFNYFKNYLTNDITKQIESTPDDLEAIVDLAISKFTNPDEQSVEDCKKNYIEDLDIKKISELYIKITKYLNQDMETAFILIREITYKVIKYVAVENKLKFVDSKSGIDKIFGAFIYKKIIPDDVISYMSYLKTLNKLDNIYSNEDFGKNIFLNLKHILKWFFKSFLNEPQFFSVIDCKAYKTFYRNSENSDNIRIFTYHDLKKLFGWTLNDFATAMLKVFYETIGENFANVTTNDELVKIIRHQPQTHKILLNEKNQVVGCWSFVPVYPDMIEKDKKGELFVSEVTPLTIPIMISGGIYDIHFGSICLKDTYNYISVFNKLLFSIIDIVEKLAINGVFLNEIVTKACTDSGTTLAESIGLKYNIEHMCKDGRIYSANIKELLNRPFMKNFTILKSLYESNVI